MPTYSLMPYCLSNPCRMGGTSIGIHVCTKQWSKIPLSILSHSTIGVNSIGYLMCINQQCKILVSILSLRTVWDRWYCPLESCVYQYSYCPSYPTVLCRKGGNVHWNPMCTNLYYYSHRSYFPSYPTVPCRIGGTVHWCTNLCLGLRILFALYHSNTMDRLSTYAMQCVHCIANFIHCQRNYRDSESYSN